MIPFTKYSGAGNDFAIVEDRDGPDDPARLARRLCPRENGVGVDGMALVRRREDGALDVRFFNPDGSEFGTCGNGSRCVALWAADRGIADDGAVRLVTADGAIDAEVTGREAPVDGEAPAGGREVVLGYEIEARVEGAREVDFGGDTRSGWLVRIGTPHFVLPLERLPDGPIDELCRPVRNDPSMGPAGANVDLAELVSRDRVRVRTFERGVEGETLACGSGVMATALALHAAGRCGPEVRFETRSGAELGVAFPDPTEEGGRIRLVGPARFVFEGRFPS